MYVRHPDSKRKGSVWRNIRQCGPHPRRWRGFFLPRIVDFSKECELIFTSRIIDANEALCHHTEDHLEAVDAMLEKKNSSFSREMRCQLQKRLQQETEKFMKCNLSKRKRRIKECVTRSMNSEKVS